MANNLKDAENTVAQIAQGSVHQQQAKHWQNLIGGINPSTLASDKGKLEYLARTQQAAIDDLEERQSNIRNLSEKHLKQHHELARIQQEEEKERKSLLKEKQERQQAYGKLQSEIKSRQARIDKLKKDQARLSSLVAAIDARLEKERRQAEQVAKKQAIRPPSKKQNASYAPQVGSFGKLKGRLTRPVKAPWSAASAPSVRISRAPPGRACSSGHRKARRFPPAQPARSSSPTGFAASATSSSSTTAIHICRFMATMNRSSRTWATPSNKAKQLVP